MSKKSFWILLTCIFFVLTATFGYEMSLYLSKSRNNLQTSSSLPATTNELSLQGTITCLPIKAGSDYKDEDGCTLGLKASNGFYYVLSDIEKLTPFKEGAKVQVKGTLDKTFVTPYQTEGRITVREYRAI